MTDPKSLLLSLSINDLFKSLSYILHDPTELVIECFGRSTILSTMRRARCNSLTIKEKIEWTVKLYDANYFIDKSIEHRQQRFRIGH